MTASSIGFVGFGALGKFLGRGFSSANNVSYYDPSVNDNGFKKCQTLDELVSSSKIVIIATPSSSFEDVISRLSGLGLEDKLIVDVLSTKTLAVDIYQRYLPKKANILSLHPLFGPPSYIKFEPNLRVVSCYKQGNIAQDLEDFLINKYNFKIITKTAQEHDMHMAYHHALPFILAHSLAKTDFNKAPGDLTIPSEEKLRKIVDIASKESNNLYLTIMKSNPYAQRAVEDLLKSLQSEQNKLWP